MEIACGIDARPAADTILREGSPETARGVRIAAHLSHDRAHEAVIYSLPWTPSTNLAQAWVKEDGKWKNDGCRSR